MTQRMGLALALVLAACGGDDANGVATTTDTGVPTTDAGTDGAPADTLSTCLKDVPTTYDSPDYATNAAAELSLRDRMKAIMDPMKAAEGDLTKKPTATELKALYAAGTPSIKSLSTTYYAGKTEEVIDAFAAAAGNTWTATEPPAGSGGKFGAYIFDAYGKDLRQQIEKGAFGAAFYRLSAELAADKAGLTEKSIDRMIALYGAHPSFPQANEGVPNPDTWVALYAKRRDDKTQATPGIYRRIKQSLITAKAAIKAKCDAERDAALKAFLLDWEKAELSTVIFYLSDASKKLSADPPKPEDQAAGLHSVGETFAFIHGFRGVTSPARKITDAEIDELLTLIGAPSTGNATAYKLITSPVTELPKFSTAIAKIASIYGFTEAEVTAFKTSY